MDTQTNPVRPIHVDLAITAHALSALGALFFSLAALLKVLHDTGSVPVAEPNGTRPAAPMEPSGRTAPLPKSYFDL
jgi:hypothetical protein